MTVSSVSICWLRPPGESRNLWRVTLADGIVTPLIEAPTMDGAKQMALAWLALVDIIGRMQKRKEAACAA